VKTYRSKPASTASSSSSDLRCLLSHDGLTMLADVYYIDVVA
jgi:hypothetical protein